MNSVVTRCKLEIESNMVFAWVSDNERLSDFPHTESVLSATCGFGDPVSPPVVPVKSTTWS